MEDPGAEQGAGEPEACGDEGEGLVSLPLVAPAAAVQATPVEDTAAIGVVNVFDQSTECGEPSQAEDEVKWILTVG